MPSMFTKLRTAARKHAEYRATVDALSRMPRATAQDLNIHQDDIKRLARQAVYWR